MIITIGIKAHLAKFLLHEESLNLSGDAIILTKLRIIPNFIIGKLVYKRKFFEEKLCEKVIKVKFLLRQQYISRGSIYISAEGIQNINSFLSKMFNWKLEIYISLHQHLNRKEATRAFLKLYGIEEEEDVAMSTIEKSNDRYRKEYPNLFPTKSKPLS